jgi:hypothetical protein
MGPGQWLNDGPPVLRDLKSDMRPVGVALTATHKSFIAVRRLRYWVLPRVGSGPEHLVCDRLFVNHAGRGHDKA